MIDISLFFSWIKRSPLFALVLFSYTSPLLAETFEEDTYAHSEAVSSIENRYLIRYDNISIIEYIKFISSISNKNFIFEEDDLQFEVTVFSEEPTTMEDILATLLQILRVHGLSLIEQGNNFVIHKAEGINQISKIVSDEVKGSATDASEIITRVFRLKNVNPERLAAIIKPMVSAGSLVEVSKETRHLIVTDINANVEKIAELLKSLDTPNTSLDIGVYTARNAYLESLVALATQILDPLKEENPLVLVPHQTSESIFIVSTPYLIDRAISVLKALDVVTPVNSAPELPKGHIENTGFYIHKLQYQSGKDIEGSLKAIGTSLAGDGTAPATGNKDIVTSIKSMKWIPSSNSLLFTGSPTSLQKIKELINSLDVAPRQVFIEVLVIETSISQSLNFGVDWGGDFTPGDPNGPIQTSAGSGFVNSAAAPGSIVANNLNPVNNLGAGPGFNFNIIGKFLKKVSEDGTRTYSTLGALVKALQGDGQSNILLSPRVITRDNNPAHIFVGEEIRIAKTENTSRDANQDVVKTFEYREVGSALTVTPTLSNEDIVTLEIDQEVSTIPENLNASLDSSTLGPQRLTKSTTKTIAHVPDKHFLILSGMIRNTKVQNDTRVPCLGGVPLIGAAFKQSTSSESKKNIMIFIRPHIVDSDEDINDITEKEKRLLKRHSKRTPHLHEVDFTLRHLNLRKSMDQEGPVHFNKRPGSEQLYLNMDKDAHPNVMPDTPGFELLDDVEE